MTNEQLAHLIERCNAEIEKYNRLIKTFDPNEGEETEQYQETINEWSDIVKVNVLALHALSAQPVKLPRIKHPAQFDYADEVAEVLKSHGIEVQE